MKHLITYFWILVAAMAFGSCTHNGGDIGVWFGTWTIESVTVDGTAVPDPAGAHYSVQFQGKIVLVRLVDDRHDPYTATYGNWAEDGDQMQWLFPEEDMYFVQLPGLTRVNKFTIIEKSAHLVKLQQVSEAGVTYTYTLRKLV